MNRIGQYADMVNVAEMFRNGLYAENSSNLDRYSLCHCASTAGICSWQAERGT